MAPNHEAASFAPMSALPLRMRKSPDTPTQELNHKLSGFQEGFSRPDMVKPCPLMVQGHSRLRSPTESSMKTTSSFTDSATTLSFPNMTSPVSSGFVTESPEPLVSPPKRRSMHRHNPSSATCSTLVNEEDEFSYMRYPYPYNKASAVGSEQLVLGDIGVWARDREKSAPMEHSDNEPVEIIPTPETPLPMRDDISETQSIQSNDSVDEDAEAVLDFALQLSYGLDLASAPAGAHELAGKFVRDLGPMIWQSSPGTQASNNRPTSTNSVINTGTPAGDGNFRGSGKRKKQAGGGGSGEPGDDDDECSDEDEKAAVPAKRQRPSPKDEENLRLSCPYRKRNPSRFNVRDHHSCAMTYFPKFAELRQHIVKQHKRDDPSAFVCGRCNRDFATRKELREHQRLPRDQMCEIADHDAESGIDASTSVKLLSRKRASGTSVEVQWREVWNIVFPDDNDHDVPTHHFTPIIEHFELSKSYLSAFASLHSSLIGSMSNPATLETLATKFHQCFVESVDQCVFEAQSKPYANRSSKRAGEQPSTAMNSLPRQRVSKELAPRPDSGVVITDELSEESGSVAGSNRGSAQSLNRSSYPSLVPVISMPPTPVVRSTPTSSMTASTGTLAPVDDVQAWAASGYAYPIHDFTVDPTTDMRVPHGHEWPSEFYNVHPNASGFPGPDFSGFL
ncbi:hypothetical protein GMORB2_7806 [Geosmithia morbida]|uniref:C2H2-type domain-containing protein n=1 Tax=Geosmithia morbida TaxID=1094350 RepID=A0A9P4YSB0_9HYPO|nr:uncharacterized protein GMORB2_7806 [Geosmithia morbida]KAF4122213.1 hypothetical protein GMORB2_7806 [Geosmithia morbida]